MILRAKRSFLLDEILTLAGGAENIEAYGKAAVVGENGEIEHASGAHC